MLGWGEHLSDQMAKLYVCETQHANWKKSNTSVRKQRSDKQNDL